MSTVAVVGGSGVIGSRVAGALAARGHRVRAISRTGAPQEGVEAVAADLSRAGEAARALAGADALYLTPPEGGDDPLGQEASVVRNAIDAAVGEGIGHVVMHTAVQAERGDTGARALDNKAPLERALAESGLGYTILRPAWYLQNLWMARDYLAQGVVSLPWPGDMAWAATDVNDIAELAVGFIETGPANAGFDVHIPGGVTGNGIAAAAGRALGREVAYQQAPVSPREYVEAFPITDAHKDLYGELFDHFVATTYLGDPGPVSRVVTGFAPRGLDEFMSGELFAAA